MTAIETNPPFTYRIIFTDDSVLMIDGYQSRASDGYLSIRTKANSDKYDTFFPLVNMFQWQRTRG